MSKKRGGPRRTPVPQIDDEHLLDTCMSHVKKHGEAAAFALGPYFKLEASQAVKGVALGDNQHLLAELWKVSPTLEFKYSSLKACFTQVLREYPGIKEKWPASEQGEVVKQLSDGILVMCNHARRISRDKSKHAEACRKLTSFQVEKLEAIRELVNKKKEPEEKPNLPVLTPSKGKQKKKSVQPSPGSSVKTDGTLAALQELEIPATQESLEEEDPLLESAQKAKPVPNRKASLREEVAQTRGLKRPASSFGLGKKPAMKSQEKPMKSSKKKFEPFSNNFKLTTEELKLMPYQKLGSCALRIQNGRQLIQVVSPHGFEESKQLALEMKKMFEKGKSLGEVKAWKEKKVAG